RRRRAGRFRLADRRGPARGPPRESREGAAPGSPAQPRRARAVLPRQDVSHPARRARARVGARAALRARDGRGNDRGRVREESRVEAPPPAEVRDGSLAPDTADGALDAALLRAPGGAVPEIASRARNLNEIGRRRMHPNSLKLFETYGRPHFRDGMRVVEIAPSNPSRLKESVANRSICWESINLTPPDGYVIPTNGLSFVAPQPYAYTVADYTD